MSDDWVLCLRVLSYNVVQYRQCSNILRDERQTCIGRLRLRLRLCSLLSSFLSTVILSFCNSSRCKNIKPVVDQRSTFKVM